VRPVLWVLLVPTALMASMAPPVLPEPMELMALPVRWARMESTVQTAPMGRMEPMAPPVLPEPMELMAPMALMALRVLPVRWARMD
jgi:hypothetical protein